MRGTALVASGSGGLADFVADGETGLLVPPGDPKALAAAVLRLLRDRDLTESIGARGREFARANLREDVYVDRMLALYRELSPAATASPAPEPAPVAMLRRRAASAATDGYVTDAFSEPTAMRARDSLRRARRR